jgi:hypothetical protein
MRTKNIVKNIINRRNLFKLKSTRVRIFQSEEIRDEEIDDSFFCSESLNECVPSRFISKL